MLNVMYRMLLAINATLWMVVVYGIKEGWRFIYGNCIMTSVILLVVPIILSVVSLYLTRWFCLCKDDLIKVKSIQMADSEFLPVYLGYFFVALSIPNLYTLIFIYFIVCLFSYISQTQYYNPIFLLMGFHYYHVETLNGTQIFIVAYGKVLRSVKETSFHSLRRINDTTFIARKEKSK